MKKVNQDPFSNGTECERWMEINCEECIKDSHMTEDGNYTKIRCAIQRDIFTRMYSNEPINERTIEVCNMLFCPYKKDHWPKRKKKDKQETSLF